jgi:hypothetical protein
MLTSPALQSYFCVIKNRLQMLQQNHTSNQLPVKIIQPLLAVKNDSLTKRNNGGVKSCKHRNENGWCSKSQRK